MLGAYYSIQLHMNDTISVNSHDLVSSLVYNVKNDRYNSYMHQIISLDNNFNINNFNVIFKDTETTLFLHDVIVDKLDTLSRDLYITLAHPDMFIGKDDMLDQITHNYYIYVKRNEFFESVVKDLKEQVNEYYRKASDVLYLINRVYMYHQDKITDNELKELLNTLKHKYINVLENIEELLEL